MAVQHLIELGHRCIGYIGANNRPRSNARRRQGYLDVLAKNGITARAQWSCQNENSVTGDLHGDIELGRCLAPQLLEAGVTAMFCYCDTVAAGAILACQDLGARVPEQVSIVGYDDNDLCEIVRPRLTTIHQPKRELGQEAMRMLLTCIRGGQVSDSIWAPSLVIRESTAKPAAKNLDRGCPDIGSPGQSVA